MIRIQREENIVFEPGWVPKTELGRRVHRGEFNSLKEVFDFGIPIREKGIILHFAKEIQVKVFFIGYINKTFEGGRKRRIRALVVVGDGKSTIGVDLAKSASFVKSIEKAKLKAVLNMRPIDLGCGSWECKCPRLHSLPQKRVGKSGSAVIECIPLPVGRGVVGAKYFAELCKLAGIKDLQVLVKRKCKVKYNKVQAFVQALQS